MTERKIKTFLFRNKTKGNVFTTFGRCSSGDTVRLTQKEGDENVGLEKLKQDA